MCVCVCVCVRVRVRVRVCACVCVPEYTQTHGDLCYGEDINGGPHGYKSL